MTNTENPIEPPVALMMQLANGRTSKRYCYGAAELIGWTFDKADTDLLEADEESEFLPELVDEMDNRLHSAGYYVWWDCGDVVVYDLRTLSEDERDAFFEQMQDA